LLNKVMQGKEGKQPNRFAAWALIGIIGAPISLTVSNPGFQQALKEDTEQNQRGSSENRAEASSESANEQEPAPSSVTAGDFTLSDVRIEPYKGDTSGADIAGELWVVYASVTNNSKKTEIPGYSMSTEVTDSEGRTFKAADFTVTSNAIVDEAFGGQKVTRFTDGILPGSTRKNVQVGVFDVSEGAQGLRLCAGGLFSRTKCIGG
jgi:hypothetical protein